MSTAAPTSLSHGLWAASAPPAPDAPPLQGHRAVDVAIVGAGYTGLSAALHLAEGGASALVLEAMDIGFGGSGRNVGLVNAGMWVMPSALPAALGPVHGERLLDRLGNGPSVVFDLIQRHGIACEASRPGTLHCAVGAGGLRDLAERARQWQARGAPVELLDADTAAQLTGSRAFSGALLDRRAGTIQPLAYARGLAAVAAGQGVAIHEQSPATSLQREGQGWRVRTPDGEVLARHVVLACGGYLAGLRRRVDASVLPIATYVMVTEPLGDRLATVLTTSAAVYDSRFAFDYYRPLPDGRLLWGGRISVLDRSPAAVERLLVADLLKVFPQLAGVRIDHAWSGLMSYARHQMPQVGEIEPGLWVAQAFGGHGVAPTTFAGDTVAAAIADGDTAWHDLRDYGLASAVKPAGFLAAQLSYWWAEARDAWKAWSERGL